MKKQGAGTGNWGTLGDEVMEERLVRLSSLVVNEKACVNPLLLLEGKKWMLNNLIRMKSCRLVPHFHSCLAFYRSLGIVDFTYRQGSIA
jgi:hypothetical protein